MLIITFLVSLNSGIRGFYKNLVVEPSSYIVAHHSIPYDATILRSLAADCPIFYLF
jgi:hypothetical protein